MTRQCRGSRSTRRTSTPACPRGPRSPTASSADRDPVSAPKGGFAPAQDFLLGRTTYEIFAAYWPKTPTEGDPVAEALNTKTKHVASRTVTSVDWDTALLIEGDVVEAVRALKAEDGGELQVHGSAGLIQTLLEPS